MAERDSYQTAIVGLGNPGKKYENTRHNVGFMVVDEISNRCSERFRLQKNQYFLSKTLINSIPAFLIKPITYMNNSGLALRQFVDFFNISNFSGLLIILDDINLPFGTIRLRDSGSAGGQKGLKSIIKELNSQDIPRLRIGIGNQFDDAAAYVLSKFSRREKKVLPEVIRYAADAAEHFVVHGIQKTMNAYNRNILI